MLSSVVQWLLRQRADNFEWWIGHPVDAQAKVFNQLIASAKDTEWGISHQYAALRYEDDFRNHVPLQDYETLKPWFMRIMQGEQNLLWNTAVKWFAKSSGTTGDRSKFIPMTRESIEDCHFKGSIDLVAAYCASNPATRIMSGKGVIVGGSHQSSEVNSSVGVGDLSAVLMQNMYWFGQWFRAPDLSVALMDDWERKLDVLAQATMDEDVTNIAGVPTWTMLLMKRIMELKDRDNLADIWRNLELYIHGGVSFTPYEKEFRSLIRSADMHYYQSYNASEGFFAFQYGLGEEDMLLHLDNGIFFEFIPSSETEKDQPRTILLHEVQVGENYGVVISTNGGLWRYVLGDTIRFTSVRPYKIQVSGRLKHYINAFGEEVIVENTDHAIAEAAAISGAVVSDYTVAPVFLTAHSKGGHEWLVEFSRQPDSLPAFAESLDASLRAINSDYDAKRQHDIALQKPIVHALAPHTFYNWLKSKNKLGAQSKVPRLSNDRKLVEEILASLRKTQ